MESLKSLFNNMSDMSKLLLKILLGIVSALIVLFTIVLFIRVVKGSKKSFDSVETIMQNAAIKYYKKNDNELPVSGEQSAVTIEQLVSQEYMKEITKYLGDNVSCNGNVTVINNNDNYAYIPNLDCKEKYQTKTLAKSLLENNEIVSEGAGLYLDGDSYVFKGEYINNYVIFADQVYRILRINDDGSIRLLLDRSLKKYKRSRWDNRYNVDKNTSVGINDYSISRIRETLTQIYEDETIFNSNQKALIVPQDLCIGAREKKSTDFSGTEECSKILEGEYLGLLQVNEYLIPSIDDNCNSTISQSCLNYNYLASIDQTFWTITPFNENSYEVYRVAGSVYLAKASGSTNVLFTLHLSDKTLISGGTGTAEDPYVIRDFTKK